LPLPRVLAVAAMIRPLEEPDAEAYVALRREALLDTPLAFAASPEDDFAGTVEQVREHLRGAPHSVIIGAFRPHLVGTVGVHRDRQIKAAHKAHVWGVYVTPGHRQQGIGAELLAAALDHARTLPGVAWLHLSVSASTPAALRLYERAGFRTWGTEPEALIHGGRAVDEHHLALRLRA
jgi:RimJ/RimL family protein N-acetyltransferase